MLVFYGLSTLLRSFRARSVNLSTLFPGKPPRQFTSIVSAHSFASNWQLPFLNQRKGDNGRRIFFSWPISSQECVPGVRVESATGSIPGGRASDRATTPGKAILKQESCSCSRAVSPPKVSVIGSILAGGDIQVPHTNGISSLSSSNRPDRTEILF